MVLDSQTWKNYMFMMLGVACFLIGMLIMGGYEVIVGIPPEPISLKTIIVEIIFYSGVSFMCFLMKEDIEKIERNETLK